MTTKRIPYSAHPPKPFEWVDSGERVLHEDGLLEVVYEAGYPCCPEHGLMAQGFDYWYCEDCEAIPACCPHCGSGEIIDFAGDEYYTPGYFCICDCGHSTVEPRISYSQFEEVAQSILNERRALIQQQAQVEGESAKAQAIIDRSINQRVAKAQAIAGRPSVDIYGGDGRNMKLVAPKSQQTKIDAQRAGESLERQIDALWGQYARLCNIYPAYAVNFDLKSRESL